MHCRTHHRMTLQNSDGWQIPAPRACLSFQDDGSAIMQLLLQNMGQPPCPVLLMAVAASHGHRENSRPDQCRLADNALLALGLGPGL